VRHFAQLERVAQLAPLGQQRDQAAVVGPQGLAQHQEGEELRLGVVVPGAGAGIGGKAARPTAKASRASRTADFVIARMGNLHEGSTHRYTMRLDHRIQQSR
jgi:hypothetical protein